MGGSRVTYHVGACPEKGEPEIDEQAWDSGKWLVVDSTGTRMGSVGTRHFVFMASTRDPMLVWPEPCEEGDVAMEVPVSLSARALAVQYRSEFSSNPTVEAVAHGPRDASGSIDVWVFITDWDDATCRSLYAVKDRMDDVHNVYIDLKIVPLKGRTPRDMCPSYLQLLPRSPVLGHWAWGECYAKGQ